MDTSPVTCRTLDDFYHIDASTFEKQYKDVLSGYRNWEELSHAEEWLVFPENIGPNLAIDETSLLEYCLSAYGKSVLEDLSEKQIVIDGKKQCGASPTSRGNKGLYILKPG